MRTRTGGSCGGSGRHDEEAGDRADGEGGLRGGAGVIYIGVDPSLARTGLAAVDEDGVLAGEGVVTRPNQAREVRLRDLATKVHAFVLRHAPAPSDRPVARFVAEEPGFVGRGAVPMAEARGAVLTGLPPGWCEVRVVTVARLRRDLGVPKVPRGDDAKEVVRLWLAAEHDYEVPHRPAQRTGRTIYDDDVADAVVAALWARDCWPS
jgi:hypothetical protein